jgi:hypothetical protein
MVFECGKDGPDVQVCTELTRRIDETIKITPVTLGNKKTLIETCGKSVKLLLEEGCDAVFIVWDLRPPYPDGEKKIDCKRECEAVKKSLKAEGIKSNKISLISICEELESWFCADRPTLFRLLRTDAHAAVVPRFKKPEKVKNPKAQFISMFQSSPRVKRRYRDLTDAIWLARECDIDKLTNVQSFARFKERLGA